VQAPPKPALSIADASVAEGNTGTTTLSFPLKLSFALVVWPGWKVTVPLAAV
jgi:hypothetical protein